MQSRAGLIRDRLEDAANAGGEQHHQLALRLDAYQADDLLCAKRNDLPQGSDADGPTPARKQNARAAATRPGDCESKIASGRPCASSTRMQQAQLQMDQSLTGQYPSTARCSC